MTFGPVSGAHFNPVVTLADVSQDGISWREVPWLFGVTSLVLRVGNNSVPWNPRRVSPATWITRLGTDYCAMIGVCAAHLVFSLPIIQTS